MVAKKYTKKRYQKGGEHINTTSQKATIDCSKIDETNLVKFQSIGDIYYVSVPVVNKLDIIQENILEQKQCKLPNKIGKGAYNCVYSTLLSTDKCTNDTQVAVRISPLKPSNFYDRRNRFLLEDGIQYGHLNNTYFNTLKNMVFLSKYGIHPKIYDIKIINDDNSYWLVVVMDKYQMNLGEFLNKYKSMLIEEVNCKLLRSLISQTVNLYQNMGKIQLTCFDVKPENMVINFDEKNQEIDLKVIDVDGDWCKDEICTGKLQADYYKVSYTFLMLSLLAYHLYDRYNFNYLSPYFKAIESNSIKKRSVFKATLTNHIQTINDCEDNDDEDAYENNENEFVNSFNQTMRHYFDLSAPDDLDIIAESILSVNNNKEGLTLDHIIVNSDLKISCINEDQPLPELPSTTKPEFNPLQSSRNASPPQPPQTAGKKRSSSNKTKKRSPIGGSSKLTKKEQQMKEFNVLTEKVKKIYGDYHYDKNYGYVKFTTDINNFIKEYTESYAAKKIDEKQFKKIDSDTKTYIMYVNDAEEYDSSEN